ncbi:Aspartate-alanine antiporter OS=Bosea thiooxidans OX=53254 GN=SAMN05660750_01448 PE=3 SV=1 [Bosea thiooxidans]|uniref:Aspartate-alanine antiporter n=1 Tax=Bosea thiooxidans TaxID=53254 RepID=A0A1T5CJC1_9HYPH|nr:aspartate-alanine antiporter [Bosea thiooxidans]SKB59431.1 aspartate-alanine antiporter [Bosea thiooxidans]
MSFVEQPVVALFISLALGYLIGKIRIGSIQVGGVCGTLFVALAIGQLGVKISPDLKNVAFALFIFALGFTAGPQFFNNIRGGWRYGILSFVEVVTVLLLLAAAVALFRLDYGTASGLFAGSATESAVLGTASEAIARLALPAGEIERLQGNMATAYSVTYLFGLVAIVVTVTQIGPLLLGVDIREASAALARDLGAEDEAGKENGVPEIVSRSFRAGPIAGSTVGAFENSVNGVVTIDQVGRGGGFTKATAETLLEPDDIVLVLGRRRSVIAVSERLGTEVPMPAGDNVPLVEREVVLVRREVSGRRIRDLRRLASAEQRRGVFISRIRRLGQNIPALPGSVLEQGDILTLYGSEDAILRAAPELGHLLPASAATDFVMLGLGIVVGLLLGELSLQIGALNLTLGTGGGALVSGLCFGWLHMHRPAQGAIPPAAAGFMKDFGLATFIAAVGLSVGPEAFTLLKQYGLILPVLSILVSALPALASLYIGRYLLKIEAPILLGAIAGQHCSTPAISALVSLAGNSTPVIGYTVTYAISNVLLPLMGPLVVGMVGLIG